MKYNTLSQYKINLKASAEQISVRNLNIVKLESALDSIFSHMKSAVMINETVVGGGSKSGEGVSNITGLDVNGEKSIVSEISSEIMSDLSYKIIYNSDNNKLAFDALDTSTGSTVTYNEGKTSAYVWFEDPNNGVVLWETGISENFPFINCLSFSSIGNKRTIKAYTSEKNYNTLNIDKNKWKEKIQNIEETVDSPATGKKYYIIAENNLLSDLDAMSWRFTNIHNFSDIAGIDRGEFIFSDKIFEGFDEYNVDENSIAGEEIVTDEYTITMPFDKIVMQLGSSDEDIDAISKKIKSEEELKQITKETINVAVEEATEEARQNGRVLSIEERQNIKQETADYIAKKYIVDVIKDEFKKRLISQYTSINTLLMLSNDGDDTLSSAMEEAAEKLNNLDDLENNASECEEKAKKILDALNIDENSTEEEKIAAANEAARELVDCIQNNEESDNEAVQQILDNLDNDGGGNGLRHDIYEKIKSIGDGGLDVDCQKYSLGVAEVTSKYFSSGVMHIAMHSGGAAIFGVGTSLMLSAAEKLNDGKDKIQQGTKSPGYLSQAQSLADGISTMYSGGRITSLVTGMMQGSPSPVPLVGTGEQQNIQHDSMKILIMISAMAAYIMLAAGGLASMMAASQESWYSMLKAVGAKDGNDLFAMLVAAGIKASLITTMATTTEKTAGSSGSGMLIPFGP